MRPVATVLWAILAILMLVSMGTIAWNWYAGEPAGAGVWLFALVGTWSSAAECVRRAAGASR